MTEGTIAHYYHWDSAPADEVRGETAHWYAPTQRFLVEMVEAEAGTRLTVDDNPDEWCVIVGPGDCAVDVRWGESSVRAGEESFTVVPRGASEVEFVTSGRVFRLFSQTSPEYRRARQVVPIEDRDGVRPVKLWDPAVGPERVRTYSLSEFEHLTDRKRVFRCTNFMVNIAIGRDHPRAADDFSPHSHNDFEQVTLALKGDFKHHIRRPWGKDSLQWMPDEHIQVGSPSATVIGHDDVHTLENIGDAPWRHVDIFAPPREDFAARGFVLNSADYPDPGAVS